MMSAMEERFGCDSKGADILFILDASTSIKPGPFQKAREFIAAVAQGLKIGNDAYQIAVDTFSASAQHQIKFNDYNDDGDDLVAKIKSIPYLKGYTDMTDAFKLAASSSFSTQNGGREAEKGYPKIAILITDGVPNGCNPKHNIDCSGSAAAAAAGLRNANVELYTVGVGSGIKKQWLKSISSYPQCMHADVLTDYAALAEYYPTQLQQRTCQSVAVIPMNQTVIRNSVTKNQTLHFQFTANVTEGMRVKVTMESGGTDFYVSNSVRTPSLANYDFHAQATLEDEGQIFISPNQLEDKMQFQVVLAEMDSSDANETVAIFASIMGRGDGSGAFVMYIDQGDTTDDAVLPHATVFLTVISLLVTLLNY